MNHYTVMIVTHRPRQERQCLLNLHGHPIQVVKIPNAPSCSYLWNQCIIRCPSEIVVICNEKARPTASNVATLLALLAEGYAIAGLYHFGFFGFPKETIRRIGFFDERFKSGGYEDHDIKLRLHEANLALYESEECPYVARRSSWDYNIARIHWLVKWRPEVVGSKHYTRLLPEIPTEYDLGPSRERTFLHWKDSEITHNKFLEPALRAVTPLNL